MQQVAGEGSRLLSTAGDQTCRPRPLFGPVHLPENPDDLPHVGGDVEGAGPGVEDPARPTHDDAARGRLQAAPLLHVVRGADGPTRRIAQQDDVIALRKIYI
jgi:hypothetical protein